MLLVKDAVIHASQKFFSTTPQRVPQSGSLLSPPCHLPSGLAALCPGLTPRKPPGWTSCCCSHPGMSERTSPCQGPETHQVPYHRTPSPTFSTATELWAKQARDSGHLFQAKGFSKPPSRPQPLEEARRGQRHTTPSRFRILDLARPPRLPQV